MSAPRYRLSALQPSASPPWLLRRLFTPNRCCFFYITVHSTNCIPLCCSACIAYKSSSLHLNQLAFSISDIRIHGTTVSRMPTMPVKYPNNATNMIADGVREGKRLKLCSHGPYSENSELPPIQLGHTSLSGALQAQKSHQVQRQQVQPLAQASPAAEHNLQPKTQQSMQYQHQPPHPQTQTILAPEDDLWSQELQSTSQNDGAMDMTASLTMDTPRNDSHVQSTNNFIPLRWCVSCSGIQDAI